MKTALFITVLIFATISSAFAGIRIELKSTAEVAGSDILLGEIAKISGDNPDGIQKLSEISVGRSALPGYSRKVQMDYIRIKIRQINYDDKTYELTGAKEMDVLTKAENITGADIASTAVNKLTESLSGAGTEVSISPESLPRDFKIPTGQVSFNVKLPNSTILSNRMTAAVEILINGTIYNTVYVPLLIKMTGDVLVAAKQISLHSEITPDSYKIQEMDLCNLPRDVLKSNDNLDGMRSRKIILPDSPITASSVEYIPVIKMGSTVTAIVKSGDIIVIWAGMVARQDGQIGSVIRIQNPGSRKELLGEIIDKNSVKINLY